MLGIKKLKDIILTQGNGLERRFPNKTGLTKNKMYGREGSDMYRCYSEGQKRRGHPTLNNSLTYSAAESLSTG